MRSPRSSPGAGVERFSSVVALLGLLDRRPVPAAAAASPPALPAMRSPIMAHRLRRRDRVLVARHQQRRDRRSRDASAGPGLGQRLAGARIAVGALAHQRLAHERRRPRVAAPGSRPRCGACTSASAIACMPASPSPRACAARARMGRAGGSGGASSGPNERQAAHASGLRARRGGTRRSCPSSAPTTCARSTPRLAQHHAGHRLDEPRRSRARLRPGASVPSPAGRSARSGGGPAPPAAASRRWRCRRGRGSSATASPSPVASRRPCAR